MNPNPGDFLLHYRLVERIGAGGMGVVWKAEDTKLGREVAVKILPPEVAGDPGRLERFDREARALAALSHPNIAQVHGLEQDPSGLRFIALEWVPGEDLSERIARGPVLPGEAIEIGLQIAAGLEAAHGRGIVHRDLKPANIRIAADGRVKLLDFGLAKNVGASSAAGDPSASPTVTTAGTLAGAILGTAAYMSPEQARGGPVDKRTDIWAFGCVMLESLSGVSPFRGGTVPETLAAVLEREPDLSALPGDTPAAVVRLIRRCLRKDPRERLRDIGDAALELDDGAREATREIAAAIPGRAMPVAFWLALLVVAALVGWFAGTRFDREAAPETTMPARLSVMLPEGVQLNQDELPGIALSPDGRWIAFVGRAGRTDRLYLRSLDANRVTELADSEGAKSPFFSPDSRWVGYLRNIDVWKAPVTGGAPVLVGQAPPIARGFAWRDEREIVYTRSKRSSLEGLSVEDGSSRRLTEIDPAENEVVHNWAQPLPGGEVLLTVVGSDATSYDEARIVIRDPGHDLGKTLVEGGYFGRLLPNDVLVYVRNGTLYGVPVDRESWTTIDPAVPLLDDFLTDPNTGSTWLDVSGDGVLAYVPGGPYEWQSGRVAWRGRDGTVEPVLSESRPFRFPRVSPNGRRALFTIEAVHDDLWVYEFGRGSLTRLTFENRNVTPVWRPKNDEITFAAVGGEIRQPSLFSLPIDGASEPRRLLEEFPGTLFAADWSPDGETLALVDWNAQQQFDVLLSGDGGMGEPEPFAASRFDEHSAVFSPDGEWIAYVSNESGRYEVYVQRVSGDGGKQQVSVNGGVAPAWNPRGGELFYREGASMMAVPVRTGAEISVDRPRKLFEAPKDIGRLYWVRQYDVARDGQRFLTVLRDPMPDMREIRIVQNWFRDVEARLDAAGD